MEKTRGKRLHVVLLLDDYQCHLKKTSTLRQHNIFPVIYGGQLGKHCQPLDVSNVFATIKQKRPHWDNKYIDWRTEEPSALSSSRVWKRVLGVLVKRSCLGIFSQTGHVPGHAPTMGPGAPESPSGAHEVLFRVLPHPPALPPPFSDVDDTSPDVSDVDDTPSDFSDVPVDNPRLVLSEPESDFSDDHLPNRVPNHLPKRRRERDRGHRDDDRERDRDHRDDDRERDRDHQAESRPSWAGFPLTRRQQKAGAWNPR